MTYADATVTRSPVKSGLKALVYKLVANFKARREVAFTTSELSKLSDRELKDIGICRSMINSVAMESACRN